MQHTENLFGKIYKNSLINTEHIKTNSVGAGSHKS